MINCKKNYNKKKNIDNDNKNIEIKKRKKEKKILRRPIENEHFDYLMNKINELEKNEILKFNKKLLNCLLFFTGMRTNEALSMDKNNILELINKGEFKIYCKKTYDYRWIYLVGGTKNKFISYFDNNMDNIINNIHTDGLVNQYGRKLLRKQAFNWMNPYFTLLNDTYGGNNIYLKGNAWGLHSYRVNFINQLVKTSDVFKASNIIGHKNLQTTLIYLRRTNTNKNEVVEAINKAFNF